LELDLLNEELVSPFEDRRAWIDPRHSRLTIQQQWELLCLPSGDTAIPPMKVTSKAANAHEAGQELLYLAHVVCCNSSS